MPKRKAGEERYYAVRKGRVPGVYRQYSDCQAQTTGFKGSIFKSFETEEDALAFVAGRTPPSESNSKKAKKPTVYYAVALGNKPGIYTDWDTAENEGIKGVAGPKKYKRFNTRWEAEGYIRQYGSLDTITKMGLLPDESDSDAEDPPTPVPAPASAKAAPATPASTTIKKPLGTDVVDIPVEVIDKNAPAPQAGFRDGVQYIYTDGACKGNGKATPKGGIGVFFGHNDERNVAEKLEGNPQTNQRAELAAIQRALEVADRNVKVMIITDSNYSINSLTTWRVGWERNGWKTSKGEPVKNDDLIKEILRLLDERKARGAPTEFRWCKGHAEHPGNVAADELACRGAML